LEAVTAAFTQQDKQYVQAHEDEYRRNKLVDELIYLWIDKDNYLQRSDLYRHMRFLALFESKCDSLQVYKFTRTGIGRSRRL
jgi:hypothetical protein